MSSKFRLGILTSHPIQNQAPLFRNLAASPQIDLSVYFCSRMGLDPVHDPGFGQFVQWKILLTEGYSFKFLKNYPLSRNLNNFFAFFNPSLIKRLARDRLDALMVHGYANATCWIAFAAARFLRIPIFLHGETVLGTEKPWFSWIKRKALKKLFSHIQAFLFIGTESRKFYESYAIPDGQLFFTPYCVDNDFFMAQDKIFKSDQSCFKTELGIPPNVPVILCASKLIPRKRPFDLLQAFEKLQRKAGLLIVGNGELRAEMENYVRRKAINNVFFTGFINQNEISKYYAIADIFVLPSGFEPWGLVINEAMCFGLPIITTQRVAAAVDLVSHENGFIYPAFDVSALAGYLDYLISHEAERKRMGEMSLRIIAGWNYNRSVAGIISALEYATG